MIMKFDHISFIVSNQKQEKALAQFGQGFKLLFKETGKQNPSQKWRLMNREQKEHSLYFFEGKVPVEVISYAKVFQGEQIEIDIENKIFYARSTDLVTCAEVLRCIGIHKIEKSGSTLVCSLKGVLDKEDYWLVVELKEQMETVYLDNEGFGCITMLVDHYKYNKSNIDKINCESIFTDPELIVVNGRQLEIVFVRFSVINVIFEFITPVRRADFGIQTKDNNYDRGSYSIMGEELR